MARKKSTETSGRESADRMADLLATPMAEGAGNEASSATQVHIFQSYRELQQRPFTDPVFVPLRLNADINSLAGLQALRDFEQSKRAAEVAVWGTIPFEFGRATGMPGVELISAIAAAPGYDVYCISPNPEVVALYHNPFRQVESIRRGFIAWCMKVFQNAGLPLSALSDVAQSSHFVFADHLITTSRFWRNYLPFATQVALSAEKVAPPQENAAFLTLLLQRLPAIFLNSEGGESYQIRMIEPASRKAQLNTHLKLLCEMKDAAIKSRSLWLAVCWVNYRNLYIASSRDSDWVKQNLKNITPTEITFPKSSVKDEAEGILKERAA